VLRDCLRAKAADISSRLKRRQLSANTVQVKVRYGDFTMLTCQITVEDPLTEPGDIYRLGCFLLGREKLVSRPLRTEQAATGVAVGQGSQIGTAWHVSETAIRKQMTKRHIPRAGLGQWPKIRHGQKIKIPDSV
jgi:hypothetical protein